MKESGPKMYPQELVIDRLRDIIAATAGCDRAEIRIDTDLFQSGILESVMLVKVVSQMEKAFHLRFPIQDFEQSNFSTLGRMAAMVEKTLAASRTDAAV